MQQFVAGGLSNVPSTLVAVVVKGVVMYWDDPELCSLTDGVHL